MYEPEAVCVWRGREAELHELLWMYTRKNMPSIIKDSQGNEKVSGEVAVHLTVKECIELVREMGLVSEEASSTSPEAAPGSRTAVGTKEAFRAVVLADVEQALSDDIVFCPSPTPLPPSVAPTPVPEESAESSEAAAAAPEAPDEEGVRRGSVSQD